MAILKHISSGKEYLLTANLLIGRNPTSDIFIDSQLVSNRHAELLWNGAAWEIHDLDSLNGTFLNRRQLKKTARAILKVGARLSFGDVKDLYQLIDDKPPLALAESANGDIQTEEDGLLIVPTAESPVYTIFDEGGGQWIAEASDGTKHATKSGDSLVIAGEAWRLELPKIVEGTLAIDSQELDLRLARARFRVSDDEEHIEVDIRHGKHSALITTRAHNYMLLVLARARAKDQKKRGISEPDQGWVHVDDLLDELVDYDDNNLNVAICRARKQVAKLGLANATDLIERRPAMRQLRIGFRHVEIIQS